MNVNIPIERQRRYRASRGFTLVEMAVVVVIMALILGSILVPLSTQVEQRQVIDTQRQLEEIKEALIGYALARTPPHLPCPDRSSFLGPPGANDGIEDRAGGDCATLEGNLPWATLGIGSVDPWGNRYRYRVTADFARSTAGTTFTLASLGDIQICNTVSAPTTCAGSGLTVVPPSDNSPVAVILSHGPNGWGGIRAATSVANTKPAGLSTLGNDESANADGTNSTFVSRTRAADIGGVSPSPEFDDIVVWLSPHTLKHRLVAAGKLP